MMNIPANNNVDDYSILEQENAKDKREPSGDKYFDSNNEGGIVDGEGTSLLFR